MVNHFHVSLSAGKSSKRGFPFVVFAADLLAVVKRFEHHRLHYVPILCDGQDCSAPRLDPAKV